MKKLNWKLLLTAGMYDDPEQLWSSTMFAELIGIERRIVAIALERLRVAELLTWTNRHGWHITSEGRSLVEYARANPWLDGDVQEWKSRALQGMNRTGGRARMSNAATPRKPPEIHSPFNEVEDEIIDMIDANRRDNGAHRCKTME